MASPCKRKIISLTRLRHKDHLIYGAAFLFWGVIAYVEVLAYWHTLEFALTLTVMTALFTVVMIGSQQERFRPDLLVKLDFLKVST